MVINGVLYFFSLYSQNQLGVIPEMQLTHTVILGWRFRRNNLFFLEAQNYADENDLVEILMEVSALTGENVEDLFSKVGEWLFIELKG